MPSIRANRAWQIWWPSTTRLQRWWINKNNWHHLPGLVQSIWRCPAQCPCLWVGETWIWWMGHLVHKVLPGQLHSVWSTAWCPSGDQWRVAFLRGWYWNWCCLTSLSVIWTAGLSAPSLLMTPNCVVQLTCWREGLPSRGTWTS